MRYRWAYLFACGVVLTAVTAGSKSPRPGPVIGYLREADRRTTATPWPASVPAGLPSRWDWREHGGVTSAKNFWPCDATWCFSAVAAVEALLRIETGVVHNLSEQQILACATPGAGCSGGWMEQAYRYMRDHGVTSEACFPYTGLESTPCHAYDCQPVATIADWVDVPNDIAALKTAVWESPVSTVMLTPHEFPTYDGSYCIEGLASSDIYAAILIVGWDDALCSRGAWICKANNGPKWGDGGFFTIGYGEHGIGLHAQRPLFDAGDGVRIEVENTFDGLIYGDGDTFPESAETFLIYLRARNGVLAPDRLDLASTVTLLDGPATCPPTLIAFGAIPRGGASTSGTEIPVTIATTAQPGAEFRLQVQTHDGSTPVGEDTLSFAVGEKTVLVVDDDDSEQFQQWYTEALARLDYPYEVWEESRRGPIDHFEMLRYGTVIWETGVLGRIDLDNVEAMTLFLNEGGQLFLTGQDIGWWLNEANDAGIFQHFYRQVLHASYLADDSGYRSVEGVPDSELGRGLTFTLGGSGGSGRQNYPSLVEPLGGATVPLEYAPGLGAAVKASAAGKLLYCAFGWEAIDQQAARDTLMQRTLTWLTGPPPDQRPPKIVLSEPVPGITVPAGSWLAIRWSSEDDRGLAYFRLERSFDSGVTWPEELGFANPDANRFLWIVGDSLSTTNRIRVTAFDTGGLARAAVMTGDFAVVEPVTRQDTDSRPGVRLVGNRPNPFNASTAIHFVLAAPATGASVRLFDMRGRLVAQWTSGPLAAGPATIIFDGRGLSGRLLASGTYHYVLEVPGTAVRGKLTVVK